MSDLTPSPTSSPTSTPASTKRKLVIAISVALSVMTAVMGFIAFEHVDAQKAPNVDLGVISQQRDEARQLVHMCEDSVSSTLAGIATGTSHFEDYFDHDPAKARKVLIETVMPVVESREFACTTAKTDIAAVLKAVPAGDRFLAAAAPRIDATIATLAKIHTNGDTLRAALDAKAPLDELKTKVATFRAEPK